MRRRSLASFIVALLVAASGAGCASDGTTRGTPTAPTASTPTAPPISAPHVPGFPAQAAFDALRTQSIFRDQVSWPALERRYREQLARAATEAQCAEAVVAILEALGDVHSSLQLGGRSYVHYEGLDEASLAAIRPLLERDRAQTGKFASMMLPDRIAYVLVPTIPAATAAEVDQYARQLQQRIAELAAQHPVGWIVDLRLNGGGNLYPMLLGLRPLLGRGVVGGSVDAQGRVVQQWVLTEQGLYWRDATGDRSFALLDDAAEQRDATAPVAVLVGPMTRSSGAATALAFVGRSHCVLLGEPSARGYTTALQPIALSPEVTLALAIAFMTDRAGTPCTQAVIPARSISGGDHFDAEDLAQDAKVRAASAWIRESAGT